MKTDRLLNLLQERKIELEIELNKVEIRSDGLFSLARLSDYEKEEKIKIALAKINRLIQERYISIEAIKSEKADIDPAEYPHELGIALLVWRAVGVNGQGGTGNPKDRIKAWLKTHYPDLSGTTAERIAKVCNWDKNGGG